MKVTPSMKNVVYSVYIVFLSSGEYIPKLSKCDCPNGWLFCSHTLACFLLIRMIRVEEDWSMDDIISFMPVPIKSLQSVPFATSFIFGDLEVSKPGAKQGKKKQVRDENDSNEDEDPEMISAIARSLAEDLPGYASQGVPGYSSASQSNRLDDDASEERRIMEHDAQSTSTDKKSVNLCRMLESELGIGIAISKSKVNKAKVTLADLTQYNLELVSGQESDANILRK